MLFSSPVFLFLFLPFTLIVYYSIPKRFKNLFLLLMSLFFYTWGEKELVILIIISTLIDYSCALIIEKGKRKLGLYLSVISNIAILGYFKYAHFVFTNLTDILAHFNISVSNAQMFADVVLPLGISFYTFQTMSYTIDVYRGVIKADKNLINYATYVSLFPQLVAGPIVRYKTIADELINRKISVSLFAEGIERFIVGLAKKMLIANNCAFLADAVFSLPSGDLSAGLAWLGVIAYSFQIYFDFSGYSDMAIGLGKMLGFNFPENFNYPYISKSVKEFWTRWHISLSTWFRDYLYIPLGGNRHGKLRTYCNLIFVFFITGLWHGASWTFIIWGLLHGTFMILERLGLSRTLNRLPAIVSHIYLLVVVSILWTFFRCDTYHEAIAYIQSMFSFNKDVNLEFLNFYVSKEVILMMLLAIVFSMPVYKTINTALLNMNKTLISYKLLSSVKIGVLTVLFIICLFYVATDSYNPFIYFRF